MKSRKIMSVIVLIAAVGACFCLGAIAQAGGDPGATAPVSLMAQSDGIAEFCLGLAAKHPWIATVLLIVGALRVVFKPIMSLLDGYAKSNCSPEEYARLQSFEAGPIYRWLCFGLDFVGSVKLPVMGLRPGSGTGLLKLIAIGAMTFGLAGCVTRHEATITEFQPGTTNIVKVTRTREKVPIHNGDMVSIEQDMFGLKLEVKDPATQCPNVTLGGLQSIVQFTPVFPGTNVVSVPESMRRYNVKTGWSPFGNSITAEGGTGHVTVGAGSNGTSFACKPTEYVPSAHPPATLLASPKTQ